MGGGGEFGAYSGGLERINLSAVIPGRREAASPESISTAWDYGFRARAYGAPRNDADRGTTAERDPAARGFTKLYLRDTGGKTPAASFPGAGTTA